MKKYIAALIFVLAMSSSSLAGCGGPYGSINCPAQGVGRAFGYNYIGSSTTVFTDTVYSAFSSTDSVFFTVAMSSDCMPGISDFKLYKNGVLDSGLVVNAVIPCCLFKFSAVGTATYTWTFKHMTHTYTHTTVFLTVTPVSKQVLPEIKVYPNPSVHGLFMVDGELAGEYSINVVNSAGQTVSILKKEDELSVIDISKFPRGLYFLVFSGDNWSHSTKVVYD